MSLDEPITLHGISLSPIMDLPPFEQFGWNADTSPHWTDLPQASQGLRELIKCNCTKRCTGNCKCKHAPLPCTELCKCKGEYGTRIMSRFVLVLILLYIFVIPLWFCFHHFTCVMHHFVLWSTGWKPSSLKLNTRKY